MTTTAPNRHWTVLLDVNDAGLVSAQIAANGRALLPALPGAVAAEALKYVEGALVDMQPGDSVESAVQCPVATLQRYKVDSAGLALLWLTETLLAASRLTKLARGFQAAPNTTIRPKQERAPADDKKQGVS